MTVTKAMAAVEPVEDDNPNGSFSLVLSTSAVDRDGEVIEPKAFDPLPDHITFDVDHGMSVATLVGSGRPYYHEDGTLRVDGTYASTPLGQETRTLVNEGHLRTASVAFIRGETETKDGRPHVKTGELLNGAFTPVPSNREALVTSSKAWEATEAMLADVKVGARNSSADAGYIQSAHDASVAAGATCNCGDGGNGAGMTGENAGDGNNLSAGAANASKSVNVDEEESAAAAAADEAAAAAAEDVASRVRFITALGQTAG